MTAGNPSSWGFRRSYEHPLPPQVEFICTKLLGSIQEAPENIAVLGLLRPQDEYIWTVVIIYHYLQRILIFTHTDLKKPLIWVPRLWMPKTKKTMSKLF